MTSTIPDYVVKEHKKSLSRSVQINENALKGIIQYICHFGKQSNVYEQLTEVKAELEKNLKVLKQYD